MFHYFYYSVMINESKGKFKIAFAILFKKLKFVLKEVWNNFDDTNNPINFVMYHGRLRDEI